MSDGNNGSGKGIFKYLDSSDFENTKIIRWLISLVFVVFAFIGGFSFSSFLLIVAALLIIPIKAPEYLLSMIKPLTALIVAVSIVLVGLIFTPDVFKSKQNNYIPQNNNQTVDSGSGNPDNNPGNSSSGSGQNSDDKEDDDDSSSEDKEDGDKNNEETDYILNTDTKKFHTPGCYSAENMNEENREEYYGTRQDLIDDGYVPCGRCKP